MTQQAPAFTRNGEDFPIVIIGSGFAGIGLAIKLKEAGIHSFTIYEREAEAGGTWRDNTYPGCACDVPSYVYSYSFEPNSNWSRMFSPGPEIQNYLLHCVEKYDLRRHMQFNTEVSKAVFNEQQAVWTLTTKEGKTVTARAVVSCVGGLTDPAYPDIKGIYDFKGKIFHTARWDHDYALKGKNVAVIGTGCSAVQVIPEIAADVSKLTVFQRTAAWILPKHDPVISDKVKALFNRLPRLQKVVRGLLFWGSEALGPSLILNSPRLSFPFEWVSARHLRKSIIDPVLREKLKVKFQFGCKRMIISSDYYPALARDNVELVTEGIAEVTEHGIRTNDGVVHELDAIILATGFDLGLADAPFEIQGLNGRKLSDDWGKTGAVAYKGVAITGYPNWFMCMGPNTGPGHTSVIIYTEAQINYIVQGIQNLIKNKLSYVTVKKDIQDTYNERIQKRMKHTVWTSGSCQSWYLNKDGTNHALYPGFATQYAAGIRKFKPAEYAVVKQSVASQPEINEVINA